MTSTTAFAMNQNHYSNYSSAKQSELVEITDPQTGRTFYANIETGECTWDKPASAIVKPKDPTGVEWWELFDDNHKLPYYYNTQTGETEWLRPDEGTIIPLIAIQNSAIGKRVSVALQRVSMIGTSHDMSGMQESNYTTSPSTQNYVHQNSPHRKASVTNQIQNGMNQMSVQNNNMVRNGSQYSQTSNSPIRPQQQQHQRDQSSGSPSQNQYQSPNFRNNQGGYDNSPTAQIYSSSPQQRELMQQREQMQQQQMYQQQQQQIYQQQQQQQQNQSNNFQNQQGNPRFTSQKQPTNFNQDAVKNARTYGIGSPVNNPEAAMNMNPLKSSGGGYSQQPPYEVKTLPKDLQLHINQFRIEGFAKKYFAQHRRGIFRRTVPVEKMLQWQKDALKAPLMILAKDHHKEALKCFKMIQKIMGDRGTISDPRPDIQVLLDVGINTGALRDEIYVQTCKQLTKNPKGESIIRGWRLLCCIVIAFPPSKNFEEYMKSFIQTHFNIMEHKQNILSQHVHKKLLRICKIGPRGKTITFQEIDRALDSPFTPTPFGESLSDIMKTQQIQWPELKLPRILPFLAEAVLNLNGCMTEGVFRVPGDIDAVTDLKCRIEKGDYDIRGITDPNVAGSLLKSWLRELADPLIPAEYYEGCIQVGHDEMAEDGPQKALQIVESLPEINRMVVQYMIRFLRIVGDPKNQPYTKMSVGNLAMVFAPNFLRCPSDNPTVIFENTKFEQAFLRILITSNVLG